MNRSKSKIAAQSLWLNYGLLAVLLLGGCGGSNPEKIVVQGNVTFEGEPIENGDIMFYPIEGTVGPMSGASVVNGEYIAKGKGGVPVGKHRVEIRAYRGANPAGDTGEASSAFSSGGPIREQYLPPRFNDLSDLVGVVEGKGRTLRLDFHLTK